MPVYSTSPFVAIWASRLRNSRELFPLGANTPLSLFSFLPEHTFIHTFIHTIQLVSHFIWLIKLPPLCSQLFCWAGACPCWPENGKKIRPNLWPPSSQCLFSFPPSVRPSLTRCLSVFMFTIIVNLLLLLKQ